MFVSDRVARWVARAVIAAWFFVPAIARACPACAANGVENAAVWYALAAFLGVPFVVAGAGFLVVRGLLADRP